MTDPSSYLYEAIAPAWINPFLPSLQPQYVFIHDALLESIMCGDNSIKAPEMRAKVKEMQQVVPETGKTVFETQFNVCMCCLSYGVLTSDLCRLC